MTCKYCGLGEAHIGMYECGTVYMGARIDALLDEHAALLEALEDGIASIENMGSVANYGWKDRARAAILAAKGDPEGWSEGVARTAAKRRINE